MEGPDFVVDQIDSHSTSSSRPMGQRLNSMLGGLSSNMNSDPGSHIANIDQMPTKKPSDLRAEPPVVEEDSDDDVQFLYCAPKSKRKKRKRSEEMERTEGEKVDPPAADTSRRSIIKPEQEPRRASAGMIEQLESCHIGPDEDIPIAVRTGSLPTTAIPTKQISIPKSALSNPSDSPTFGTHRPCQPFPRGVTLPATWEEAPSGKECRSICLDGHSAKRQKRDEPTGIADTNLANSSYLPQVSPKTIASSVPNLSLQSSSTPGYMGMLGSSRMQDMLGLAPAGHAINISWAEFDCRQPMDVDPRHNRLHYDSGTMSPDVSSPGNTISSHPPGLHPRNSDTTSLEDSRSNMHIESATSPTCIPQSNNGNSDYLSLSSLPRLWQREQQTSVPLQSQPALESGSPIRSNAHLPSNRLPISKGPSLFWRTPHPPHLNQPRVAGRNTLHNSLARPADILRKPSLYKIPPWPSTSNTAPCEYPARPVSNATQQLPGGNSTLASKQRSQSGLVPVAASGPFGPTQARQVENGQDHAPVATSSNYRDEQYWKHSTTDILGLDDSRKRGRHEHSPNLIVDMAETCQRLFPFSAFAARHNKPVQKVFDTFSAIVQIPLLRNAQDNRRHGSLGKRRMREYREAKKAMERANEDARRERTGRIHREECGAEERGKAGAGNESGLLKRAVVRNARETTGTV